MSADSAVLPAPTIRATPARTRTPGAPPREQRPEAVTRVAYMPALDGLRMVAVLAVLFHHTWMSQAPGGWVGVDLFFVLSGYLITALLTREWQTHGRLDLRRFYMRRALRLVPALATAVALAMVIVGVEWPASMPVTARSAVGALTATGNWLNASGAVSNGILAHTWSLAVEEQFYWLWPLAVAITLRRGGPRAALMVACAGVCLSVADHIALSDGAYYRTDARAEALLLGCAAALAETLGMFGRVTPRQWTWAGILAASGLGAAVFLVRPSTSMGVPLAGVDLLAFVLVLAVTRHGDGPLATILARRIPVWIGRRAYGIYLYSVPLLALVLPVVGNDSPMTATVVPALTLLTAAVSYRYVERPFLSMRWRYTPTPATVGSASAAADAAVRRDSQSGRAITVVGRRVAPLLRPAAAAPAPAPAPAAD